MKIPKKPKAKQEKVPQREKKAPWFVGHTPKKHGSSRVSHSLQLSHGGELRLIHVVGPPHHELVKGDHAVVGGVQLFHQLIHVPVEAQQRQGPAELLRGAVCVLRAPRGVGAWAVPTNMGLVRMVSLLVSLKKKKKSLKKENPKRGTRKKKQACPFFCGLEPFFCGRVVSPQEAKPSTPTPNHQCKPAGVWITQNPSASLLSKAQATSNMSGKPHVPSARK